MATVLSDLDELLLSVRDINSRKYAHEAILAHRNGLNRASLVSLWIAVAYDIISKVRELSYQGDRAALAFIVDLDGAVQSSNVRKLQDIERDLIKTAAEVHEFVGERERKDLERLKIDRDACAHPGFVQTDLLFDPTPELVRQHIVTSIKSLLSNPPVQGKSALAQLHQDLIQPSFPERDEDVQEFMNKRYLDHAKESLVESMISALFKVIIRESEPQLIGHEVNVRYAIFSIANRHALLFQRVAPQKLRQCLQGADDSITRRVFPLLKKTPQIWDMLDSPVQIQLRNLLSSFGSKNSSGTHLAKDVTDLQSIVTAVGVDKLREDALLAFGNVSEINRKLIIQKAPRAEFSQEAIRLFSNATSFKDAGDLGKRVLLPIAPHLTASDVGAMLIAASSNAQIWSAGEMPDILKQFFDLTEDLGESTRAHWESFIQFIGTQGFSEGSLYNYDDVRERMKSLGWAA